jgi:hypothetical protein
MNKTKTYKTIKECLDYFGKTIPVGTEFNLFPGRKLSGHEKFHIGEDFLCNKDFFEEVKPKSTWVDIVIRKDFEVVSTKVELIGEADAPKLIEVINKTFEQFTNDH